MTDPHIRPVPPSSGASLAQGKKASADAAADLPGQKERTELQGHAASFLGDPRMSRVIGFMQVLAANPPQVLLIEGGTAHERLMAAHIWATMLNCPASTGATDGPTSKAPCCACPTCLRVLCRMHRDIVFLDGSVDTIKIAEIRELKGILGEPPREAAQRVIILREAQGLLEAAANALLKSLEDPSIATSFLLLVPQRERLLPTLVSRSMVITLPWPVQEKKTDPETSVWITALCSFVQTGKGFFQKTGKKGDVTVCLVQDILSHCQQSLNVCLQHRNTHNAPTEPLALFFFRLPLPRLRMLYEILSECQESLQFSVNPTLVLEWLATRLYLLGR